MAAARPLVTVQGLDGAAAGQTALPAVFTAPIRPDVVLQVRWGEEGGLPSGAAPARKTRSNAWCRPRGGGGAARALGAARGAPAARPPRRSAAAGAAGARRTHADG